MNINAFLDYASRKYYEGTPVISDEEFDVLVEKHKYTVVGHRLESGVPHLYHLYSLQKVFEGENKDPLSNLYHDKKAIVISPKLDGAAVALTYYKGKFIRALSRGDGKLGQDITNNIKHIVPSQLIPDEDDNDLIQIIGEVVALKTLPNARNYAAGALNLKSEEEFKSRDLTFIAYGIYPYMSIKWCLDMCILRDMQKFNTVIDNDWRQFPQDGLVIRIDNYKSFEDLGYTSHHPRGAYALKSRPEGAITKLIDVKWQVGKSGVVSPVAILEPVKIGDAIISKATLHNIKYIQELDLEIGCSVEIIRSGEIIPRVVRRV